MADCPLNTPRYAPRAGTRRFRGRAEVTVAGGRTTVIDMTEFHATGRS